MKTYIVRTFISLILLLSPSCLVVPATAQMLTFEFSGTLTEVVSDNLGIANRWGVVGDPFTGYLSYDSSYWESNPDAGYNYVYGGEEERQYKLGEAAEAAIVFSVSTPSFTAQIPQDPLPSTAWVNNSPGNYSFSVNGEYSDTENLSLNFNDATGAGLIGTDLPTTLDLNNWSGGHNFEASILTSVPGYIRGDITSLQLTSLQLTSLQFVPEPRTETVLGLGIVVWILKRRAGVQDKRC